MKKLCTLFSIYILFTFSSFAQKDTSFVSIANFRLDPGTFSWRGTNTFYDMTAWDSSPYTEGHLMFKNGPNWQFRMNYRLLVPVGYDPGYSEGYPMIVMLHGAGERGNCWDTNCYCKDCNVNATPDPNANPEFMNNDHVLLHGGQPHLNAVNLAGSKKPDDPSLNPRAFPGFVLFPQNESFWGGDAANNTGISFAIRIIRLLSKKYNIDENRIYVHGLSMGGQAVYKAINMADWLFAAAATMSAISYYNGFEYDSAVNIPLWAFQGGKDTSPNPNQTQAFVNKFREAGGVARYTEYPHLGHGTWNTAYREPDFFSWFLSKRKSDIHVHYENPTVCSTNDTGAKLSVADGFSAYQWERDGEIIADAKSNIYQATTPGIYRVRFSRTSATPTEEQWNKWSKPVTITEQTPFAGEIGQKGTTYLKDLNGKTDAVLTAPEGFSHYYWYKDGELTDLPDSSVVNISPGDCGTPCSNAGTYSVSTAGFDNCPSGLSSPKYVFFEDQAPIDNSLRPTSFTHQVTSPSRVFFSWKDNSTKEAGYEIWRKNTTATDALWEMAALLEPDVTYFEDTVLLPGMTYFYKIRAIGEAGRSDYTPGNDPQAERDNLIVNTAENAPPAPPQNLVATQTGVNQITLAWEAGTDDAGIQEYVVSFADQVVKTNSDATSFIIGDLTVNTTYSFTVKSIDNSGVESTPSNQATANTFITGLYYKHTTGNWTDLEDPTLTKTWDSPDYTGKVDNFTLEPRTQEDYFNFEFEGYLYISTPGTYTFYLNSNDGSRLFLDDVMQIDFNGVHNNCSGGDDCPNGWGKPSTALNLTAGPHLIRVQMFEYTGAQNIAVRYSGPDTNNTGIAIPSEAFTSGTYTPPPTLAVPTNVVAVSKGLKQIDLTWQSPEAEVEFEIYRALSANGPFSIINRVDATLYSDSTLQPGKTYYYKLRTVNATGASAYSAIVKATTAADTEAPDAPTGLKITAYDGTSATLIWTASADNVGVTGYEIWANGELAGTASLPGFEMEGLDSGTMYEFTVIAYDASGNKSEPSETISTESFTTPISEYPDDVFNLDVFPNPSAGSDLVIRLFTIHSSPCRIRMIDLMSRTLSDAFYDPLALREGVKLPDDLRLKPGVYVIRVEQQDKQEEVKIVVR